MHIIIIKNINDLDTLLKARILITHDYSELKKEIDSNMWCLSLSDTYTPNASELNFFLNRFFEELQIRIHKKQLIGPIVFYLWFDALASQLRFNVISNTDKRLPFGCDYQIVETPDCIIDNFLKATPYLILDDLSIDNEQDEINSRYLLDVFIKKLN